ncbi:hypothetical protein AB1Y20_003140 [Prymnesium parvum]|uniref:Ion transport domain-containing protein n=1 Tax=Prymnesium parvum TaxID=97485 RepID=A0AB34JCS9_PRYPA
MEAPTRTAPCAKPPRQEIKPHSPARQKSSGRLQLQPFIKAQSSREFIIPPKSPDMLPWPVIMDWTVQHTIHWSETLHMGSSHLEPGSANLYKYPAVRFDVEAFEDILGVEEGLPILQDLVLSLLVNHEFFDIRDSASAYPIHALLVANNDSSLQLCFRIFEACPRLMACVHGPGPFKGESALHILIVNGRFKEACALLELAAKHLSNAELYTLLLSPADGGFFTSEPMMHYGGTPLAWACHHSAKEVVSIMLSHPRLSQVVDLNRDPCPNTGYFSAHAAVASGNVMMVNFLLKLDGLDRGTRNSKAADFGIPLGKWPLYTPLQLAFKLGDSKMTERIIYSLAIVQWEWGPLASLAIPLAEIDSAGPHPNDCMHILELASASAGTKEMILDTFMQGFIFKLFDQKWEKFGKHVLMGLVSLKITFASFLISVGMSTRHSAEVRHETAATVCILLALAQCVIYSAVVWKLVVDASSQESYWKLLPEIWTWMRTTGVRNNIIAYLLTIGGCICSIVNEKGRWDEVERSALAVAFFVTASRLLGMLFLPFQQLGVFARVVDKLVSTDLPVFLTFLFSYMTIFYFTLYIAYPAHDDDEVDVVPEFNDPFTAAKAMLDLAIAGQKPVFDTSAPWVGIHSWHSLVVFAVFYYLCLIMIVVLLMRLFMAMLSATFNGVKATATLEWRLQFLRFVLFAELLRMHLPGETFAGEKINDQWVYLLTQPKDRRSNVADASKK